MNTLVFSKLWKYGNVEMCRDRLLMLSMCRNGEKCLDYLVTEFDVTVERLKTMSVAVLDHLIATATTNIIIVFACQIYRLSCYRKQRALCYD